MADDGVTSSDPTYFVSDTTLLPGIVEGVLHRADAKDWTVRAGAFWCSVRPDGHESDEQGWKLHLSATPLSAALVLTVASEVLIEERASFKFAGTVERITELTGGQADRGSGGKFITVYPDGPDHFRRLARRLHEATDGLRGPGILSDRRYRPDSLVHYRYGVFNGVRTMTNDGSVEVRLRRPDGGLEEDRRKAWVTTPAWAPEPFPLPVPEPPAAPARTAAPVPATTTAKPPAPAKRTVVLLNGRYTVSKAIRHAYKGGVYFATDRDTRQDVVIKEARPHVGVRIDGTDLQDTLRYEAGMLDLLAPLGFTPRAIETFAQGGNLFLVQEQVTGQTLRKWVSGNPCPGMAEFLHLAHQILDVVAGVHGTGHVLRDLSPNNLMVTSDGRVRLIDVELLAPQGVPTRRGYTPGYAGPELTSLTGRAFTTPEYEGDLYSLGAVLLYLATGVDPLLPADIPDPRPADERIRALAVLAVADRPWAAPLLPALLALCSADPAGRWELTRVRDFLTELRTAGATPAAGSGRTDSAGSPDVRIGASQRDRLISDGLTHMLRTRGTGREGHLWPLSGFGASTDPLNVQYGAAGALAVMTRGAAAAGSGAGLRDGVAEVTEWIRERLSDPGAGRTADGVTLPGLHFGRSGTAWALLDSARLLGDDAVAETAIRLALDVPVDWPNRDICHGAAGAGMTQLHFWRTTGQTAFRDRVVACGETLLAAAENHPGGVIWPIPATFDSQLAGARHFGFAHGVAGIGAFLLAAGRATGREDFVRMAHTAGDTLAEAAQVENGQAWWPADAKLSDASRTPHWCTGASGVGTFLIRLWQATGQARYRDLAELGAATVRGTMWQASPAACHGLSGNAEFLLDMAAALDEPRYLRWATELAACIHARAAVRDGLLVVPDETLEGISIGYGTGLAGAVGMLLRLRDGGSRLWMPDSLSLPAPVERSAPAMAGAS